MASERTPQDLRLEDVSRRFGDIVALDRTNLQVEAGELLALLGPSGCGKTTTLRIIAGFEFADTGRVLIGGRDLGMLAPNRRALGMVFQDYSLFPHMTVARNVGFGLRMAKVPRAEIGQRVTEALALVRLQGFDERYPNQLSGGQQQRVALARSLVTNPSVLLLDEPLAALDKNLRESMQFELRRIQQMLGITTVIVTHDQEEALTLSDRVAVMQGGRIMQVGTPREVYDSPRNRFVSEFLGTANLFEGELAREEGVMRLRVPEGADLRLLLPASAAAATAGRRATIAVRPEKIRIASQPMETANRAQALVVGHVFRGTYHAYQLTLTAQEQPLFVYQQAQSRLGEENFNVGDSVHIGWSLEDSIVLEQGDQE